ncbi:hypothetical protein NEMIN01_2359, partial [Nematocida minor]|uniref:uncharacterized protein n=1 Tax=Nematocida minor TaxID=1912983 RepID=UPI002220C414
MKKVKLKINIDKAAEACESADIRDCLDANIADSIKLSYFAVLKCILDNIEIESSAYTDEEKEKILGIVKNGIYQYFIYYGYGLADISHLHDCLLDTEDNPTKPNVLSLVSKAMDANPFIYDPKHGIYRNSRINENTNEELSTRTYTLKIKDRSPPVNLEGLLKLTSESLDRDIFCYVSNSVKSMDMSILKKYSPTEKYYSLDDLYKKKYKSSEVSLVDHGLKFIHENYYKIAKLIRLCKEIEVISNRPGVEIEKEISELFGLEDLKIVVSIGNNIKEINYEKRIHNHMIKAIEYMADHTNHLKRTSGSNTLKIKRDLSDFCQKYVDNMMLKRKVLKKRDKLGSAFDRKARALGKAHDEYNRKSLYIREYLKRLECYKNIVNLSEKREIKKLQNHKNSIEWQLERESLQSDSIRELQNSLQFLPKTSPVQQEYMFKKIKELGKERSIEVIE